MIYAEYSPDSLFMHLPFSEADIIEARSLFRPFTKQVRGEGVDYSVIVNSGIFVHELTHFLQFTTTKSGIRYLSAKRKMAAYVKRYFDMLRLTLESHIEFPLNNYLQKKGPLESYSFGLHFDLQKLEEDIYLYHYSDHGIKSYNAFVNVMGLNSGKNDKKYINPGIPIGEKIFQVTPQALYENEANYQQLLATSVFDEEATKDVFNLLFGEIDNSNFIIDELSRLNIVSLLPVLVEIALQHDSWSLSCHEYEDIHPGWRFNKLLLVALKEYQGIGWRDVHTNYENIVDLLCSRLNYENPTVVAQRIYSELSEARGGLLADIIRHNLFLKIHNPSYFIHKFNQEIVNSIRMPFVRYASDMQTTFRSYNMPVVDPLCFQALFHESLEMWIYDRCLYDNVINCPYCYNLNYSREFLLAKDFHKANCQFDLWVRRFFAPFSTNIVVEH